MRNDFPNPEPRNWLLATLTFLVGIGAAAGGAMLAWYPDGSALHMPVSLLRYSPFSDFRIPGLILFLVVGCGQLWASAVVLLRRESAPVLAMGAGLSLMIWISVEMVMLRAVHWLHVIYFALGAAIFVASYRARRRANSQAAADGASRKGRLVKRILVTYGSKRGGTAEMAQMIGDNLSAAGFDVEVGRAEKAGRVGGYDAAIVGGALYAFRWHSAARGFVHRHARSLKSMPVWFFSSGPLDDSAMRRAIPPTSQVSRLMRRAGARGHATFGGRLTPDAKGFAASAMAKQHSGDWRNLEQLRSWATEIARALQLEWGEGFTEAEAPQVPWVRPPSSSEGVHP